jgi:nitrite reductase (cytochrome c-552)
MAQGMPSPAPARSRSLFYVVLLVVTAAVTFGLVALLMNIRERREEAQEHFVKLVELTEDTIDPAIWGRNFPRQYDSYKRTVDMERTRHGGNEAYPVKAASKLELDPFLRRLYQGYAFSVDFREKRGHAYMLSDQDVTERTIKFKQPGACLHCHSSIIPAYRQAGGGDVMKGFEVICPMPLAEARKLVEHPVSCLDCHDPETAQLRVTRPGFLVGIKELAKAVARQLKEQEAGPADQRDPPLPHLTSIHEWAKKRNRGQSSEEYDVNAMASRQELRSFVCGQCHVEYYFKPEGKLLTYPWHNGLKIEQMEAYYDSVKFHDWVHTETGTEVLKAQHPEFELWNQGIHARSGVACADCHMPYIREGAIKVSDHHVRSPMLNVARACQTCHRYGETEIKSRVAAIQGRTRGLLQRAENALGDLMDALVAQMSQGAEKHLGEARRLHRQAQWRLDFVLSENSLGFHASQESARILGEAIDYARQGQVKALQK